MTTDPTPPAAPNRPSLMRRVFRVLGPGLIAGAADDDPAGIATYSIAGAQFGLGMLWTALLTWPLMAAVQMMCARVGMVTGRGLAGALRHKMPRWFLVGAACALLLANTLNIGADLAGMGDAAEMITGVNAHWFILVFGVGITWATIRFSYRRIAGTLKWLALVLLAYVVAGIDIRPDWGAVIGATLMPDMPQTPEAWGCVVAILGTTISPYLFFWQASQEVEEEKALGRTTLARRQGATHDEIVDRKLDVGIGTLLSNVVMFFVILTTGLTVHAHGLTNLQSSRDVAAALIPIAGRGAGWLYTAGILGVGLLAIPTLAGSAAYALSETFAWRQGLNQKFRRAPAFYGVIVLSTVVGMAIDFAGWNPIRVLYLSAVVNGLLAPFLLFGALAVACDRKLMNGQPSSILGRTTVFITALFMIAAGIATLVL